MPHTNVHVHAFHAMGCHMQCLIGTHNTTTAPTQAHFVAQAMVQWESVLSRFRPESELNLLHARPGTWRSCSPTLWDVIQTAHWAWQWSGGLIDPTIRGALERAGYPGSSAQASPVLSQHTGSWADVELDTLNQRIKIPAHLSLDLAGVAKSWAAQQALTLCDPDTVVACDAAGDIALRGAPLGYHAWPIDIEPLAGYCDSGILAIDDAHGIATSGIDQRHWLQNGRRQHHIIDPRTGQVSTSDIVRASVIAPTTIMADVAARMCIILGSTAMQAWLMRTPDIAVFAHLTDGNTFQSTGWQHYQWPTAM